MASWWQSFFDDEYLRLWGDALPAERSDRETAGVWELLGLAPGQRVLDAPCGFGRISLRLARLGAAVLGVDQSAESLAAAEAARGDLPAEQLRYLRHDLREPLAEGGFDAAINVFSSLGYGTENDDRAVLATLAAAVRPGGRVFVETMHRDAFAARFARGQVNAQRLDDGTLVVEEPLFDPIAGRVETCWYYWGPHGGGAKSASIRVYSITDLVRMMESVGLRFVSAHAGCSPQPYAAGLDMGGRAGLLAVAP